MLFFAEKHRRKTRTYLSQTALYKYLAFFELRYLEKTGIMPLDLTYYAMQNGPVPTEIYNRREEPGAFSTVDFETFTSKQGNTGYIIKPRGTFNPDYFAEAELEEMNNLIEIFAAQWVTASVMSDASHKDIRSWKKTFYQNPNTPIDPLDEFKRDIVSLPEEALSSAEMRFLIHKKMIELAR